MTALVVGADGRARCTWCVNDTAYVDYHDNEWGRPVLDDRILFEKICLEGFQAGLSWLTILRKRGNFRVAFHGFDVVKVASMTNRDVESLLTNEGIIRHRGKIEAVINNAQKCLDCFPQSGSLSEFVWSFSPGEVEHRIEDARLPASTAMSTSLSKELRRLGWKFVGPTTMYAFMQSMGLVNDHFVGCHVREECEAALMSARASLRRA